MYDAVPSPMLFDDEGFMTKPEKSELIQVLEEKLESGDYSHHHQPGSVFLIDVMATVRRIPLVGLSDFSGLLTKFTEMTDIYHTYGRCDYIFDIYDDTPSLKDSEWPRRASVAPVELSSVELTTPLHKSMTTFWPSNKNKLHLETLVYRQICHQSSEKERHSVNYVQTLMSGNVSKFTMAQSSAWITYRQRLRRQIYAYPCKNLTVSKQVIVHVLYYPTILM